VVRAVTEIGIPIAIAGVGVSVLALLGTLFFLYELAARVVGEAAAKRATIAFVVFPTSFFLVASYSEALFVFLSAGCLWGIYVHRDLTFAAPFAYCAALTRSVGVFLVIPLAYVWWRGRREFGRPSLLAVAAPVLGLLAYMAYLWRVTREPFLFTLAYERGWGRRLTDPVTTFVHGARVAHEGVHFLWAPWRVFETTSANPPFALANSLNIGFCVVLLTLVVLAFVRLPLSLALYCLPLALSPLTVLGTQQPLASMPRYVLAVLPVFLVLGGLFVRRTGLFVAWCAVNVAVGFVLTLEFVTWRWVA
ncbi:MAG TPA: mannosyltransferase family protein, partial [Polyangiaceae bacterium]|nr:mannosyltransferase family protein [Polyangiaceae bacterium]